MTWYLENRSITEQMLQAIQMKHPVKKLKLQENNIGSLKLFKCETLRELDLSSNKIKIL